MATTTPFAPNQSSGFSVPQQPNPNPNFKLTPQNMTIGQFGLPQNSGTNTSQFSPVQNNVGVQGSFMGGTVSPKITSAPTSTGFQAGANGTFTGNANSVWNSPAVTQNNAAKDTKVSTLPPTPPAPVAPTPLNNGAAAGGGQPFQGNYTFDANGNVTGQTAAPPPSVATAPNMNQQPSNPASNTASQTSAIINNLNNIAGQGSQGDQAEQDLQSQIKNLETSIGLGEGQILGTPEPLQFQTGQQAALLAQRNPELQALTNQLASLQANRTASIGAGTSAAGASNTLQGLEQQTTALSPGQGLYSIFSNPGQQIGGNATLSQLGGSNGVMQSLAQQVISGQLTEQQAESQLPGGVPAVALNQEEQALKPGFNTNTATAQAQAQASNVGIAGTAQTTANQGIYNTALSNLSNYQNMAANIKSFGDQAVQNISSLGLSPSQSINAAIQAGATQLNNPAYAQFNTNIQGLQARVSSLLQSGELPTTATNAAQSIINGNLNLGALQATLNQINNEANSIVQNQSTIASSAYKNIQGATNNQPQNNGTTANPWH